MFMDRTSSFRFAQSVVCVKLRWQKNGSQNASDALENRRNIASGAPRLYGGMFVSLLAVYAHEGQVGGWRGIGCGLPLGGDWERIKPYSQKGTPCGVRQGKSFVFSSHRVVQSRVRANNGCQVKNSYELYNKKTLCQLYVPIQRIGNALCPGTSR